MTRSLQEIDRLINRLDEYPTEPSEKEYWQLASAQGWDYGNGNCYDGTPPRLTAEQREQLRQYWNPKRDYDDIDVRLGHVRAEQLDPVVQWIADPVDQVDTAEFNWRWQTTSNSNNQSGTRDRLRLGRLFTRTQTHTLWGFESWQEFNSHLHLNDKQQARDYYEEIKYAVANSSLHTGDYSMCFWLAKDDNLTRPGWWAISVDSLVTPGREILVWANGRAQFKQNLAMIKQNTIRMEKTK